MNGDEYEANIKMTANSTSSHKNKLNKNHEEHGLYIFVDSFEDCVNYILQFFTFTL